MENSVNFLSIVAKIKWSPSTSRKSTKILANRPFWLKIWIRSRGKLSDFFFNPVNSWNSTLDFNFISLDFNGNSTDDWLFEHKKKKENKTKSRSFKMVYLWSGWDTSTQITLWVKFHQIFQSLPHSSEIQDVRSNWLSRETLQNLPYIIYRKSRSCFFHFWFPATLFYSQMYALVYVDIEQGIH